MLARVALPHAVVLREAGKLQGDVDHSHTRHHNAFA